MAPSNLPEQVAQVVASGALSTDTSIPAGGNDAGVAEVAAVRASRPAEGYRSGYYSAVRSAVDLARLRCS